MDDSKARIREALKVQRYDPATVGGEWEEFARRYPDVAATGYETRAEGEHLVDPYPSIPDSQRSYISYPDQRYGALAYGWHLRHDEADRPRDRIDDDLDKAAAEEADEFHEMYDIVYSWSNARRNHPGIYEQGRAARDAGLPLEPPAELVTADLAENDIFQHREKAWRCGWSNRDQEIDPRPFWSFTCSNCGHEWSD
jgi:hypothetical protein